MRFDINTTSDISKLSQIVFNNFEISFVVLYQISLQIMLLPIQIKHKNKHKKFFIYIKACVQNKEQISARALLAFPVTYFPIRNRTKI